MTMRYVEDPSIAGVARLEHARMVRELGERFANGEPFFAAREAIMARDGPAMAKRYGQEVAKRALQALTSHAPADFSDHILSRAEASADRHTLQFLDDRYGGRHEYRNTWLRPISPAIGQLGGFIVIASAVVFVGALVFGAYRLSAWPLGIGLGTLAFLYLLDKIFPIGPVAVEPRLTGAALDAHREAVEKRRSEEAMARLVASQERAEAQHRAAQEERDNRAALQRMIRRIEKDAKAAGR